MRLVFGVLAAAMLGGCQSVSISGDKLRLQTDPPGALVVVAGAGECETPCTIRLNEPQRARIAKAGYVTRYVILNPSRRKQVIVDLELAAASEDVDAVELPALE